jgi:hypothetical protein
MDEALKHKIISLLDRHRIMMIATLRPDGWPQATSVGYVNEGLTLYFLCGLDSQKAANIARDDRVSLVINDDPPQVMEITGRRPNSCERIPRGRSRLATHNPAVAQPKSANVCPGARFSAAHRRSNVLREYEPFE